jgi:hypothetical protein
MSLVGLPYRWDGWCGRASGTVRDKLRNFAWLPSWLKLVFRSRSNFQPLRPWQRVFWVICAVAGGLYEFQNFQAESRVWDILTVRDRNWTSEVLQVYDGWRFDPLLWNLVTAIKEAQNRSTSQGRTSVHRLTAAAVLTAAIAATPAIAQSADPVADLKAQWQATMNVGLGNIVKSLDGLVVAYQVAQAKAVWWEDACRSTESCGGPPAK